MEFKFGWDLGVVKAIAYRDLQSYLANPTGYVFLTLFIGLTGAGAFLQEQFFARNLADLALLNDVIAPILMLFVPAVTMSSWADERRSGTDELLLTMPVRDMEVVLGKYLGAFGVYSVALLFCVAHIVVLAMLGEPDPGLMLATYLGYWLMGALFVAVGLLASMLSANLTVAFVFGVLGCAALVFAAAAPWASGLVACTLVGALSALVTFVLRGTLDRVALVGLLGALLTAMLWLSGFWPGMTDVFAQLSAPSHFESFGRGVIRLGDVIYFVGGSVFLVYLSSFLLGRRHW